MLVVAPPIFGARAICLAQFLMVLKSTVAKTFSITTALPSPQKFSSFQKFCQ